MRRPACPSRKNMDGSAGVAKLTPHERTQRRSAEEMEDVPSRRFRDGSLRLLSRISSRSASCNRWWTFERGRSRRNAGGDAGADFGEKLWTDHRCARFVDRGTDRRGGQGCAPGASQHNVEQMEAIPVPRIMEKFRRRNST